MTGVTKIYQLWCGCPDWCTCPPCLRGTPHDAGTLWECDVHGRTSVKTEVIRSADHSAVARTYGAVESLDADMFAPAAREAIPDEVAVVYSPQPFTFPPGSRMRTTRCLMCGASIGGDAVVVLGIAALDGAPCSCGGIVSDTFLLHMAHMPIPTMELKMALARAIACDFEHQQP